MSRHETLRWQRNTPMGAPLACAVYATSPPVRGPPDDPRSARRPARAGDQPALGVGPRGDAPVRADLAGLDRRRCPPSAHGAHDLVGAPRRPRRRPGDRPRPRRRQGPPRRRDHRADVVRHQARRQKTESPLGTVAYFSPEFGLTEALPQYSGGLGVLVRRPPQGVVRPRRPARRHRPAVHRGLLPPGARRRRLAAGAPAQHGPASRSGSPTPVSE